MKFRFISAMCAAAVAVTLMASTVFAAGTPYGGSPIKIGHKTVSYVNAVDFNLNGYQAGYEFGDWSNHPYRDDGFATDPSDYDHEDGTGWAIGWLMNASEENGTETDWADYTVEVVKSGKYKIQTIACSNNENNEMLMYWDGSLLVSGNLYNASWEAFELWDLGEADLYAGTHTLRMTFTDGEGVFNVDAWVFTLLEEYATESGSDSASGGKDVPVTGDASMFPQMATVFAVSASGICSLFFKRGKKS